MRVCKFKVGRYWIDFNIYKKSTKIRGFKWFQIIPTHTFNSKGFIFSSLFFHLNITKMLFELPDEFNMNDFVDYRREKCKGHEDDDYCIEHLEDIKKSYMLEKFNMSI